MNLAEAVAQPRNLSRDAMVRLLAAEDPAEIEALFAAARAVREKCSRTAVLPRGLIECSNVCAKDCRYCGIRKSNPALARYTLTEAEVRECLDEARRRGYPAVAFQAGEIESEANTAYYERLLAASRDFEVTLSLGEQTEEVYRRWKDAGAMRYLIRIETSNRELYAKIHPAECSFERRLGCIRTLKRLGYVTGSGVMIGLPGQTVEDLARDIVFYGEENLDMVGMGPYVPNGDTPLGTQVEVEGGGGQWNGNVPLSTSTFDLALRMIALTRLYLWDVNIVAATALGALDPENGLRRGIEAGANVAMPELTPAAHAGDYVLYPRMRK